MNYNNNQNLRKFNTTMSSPKHGISLDNESDGNEDIRRNTLNNSPERIKI